MKSLLAASLVIASSFVLPLTAADAAKGPYTVGSSYLIVFSATALNGVELPTGPTKIVAESGDWIQVQYSTSKNERSKSNPGEVVAVETVHKAWINLDHVAAFIEAAKAE